ncbi:hypothetical protein [Geomicrobium sp. JCM 19055]|uniref:hypothetical protein n=1 Tax=Geomicrobium sp. JCM 19055 TaxID=1460649 RepID=UPI0012687B71|nr:hypothetical protein [Geomicrobium sp. JCM 19055]
MKIRKWLTIAAVAIAAVVSLSIIYENVSSPPVGVNQGMQAPDFTLERGDVEGEKNESKRSRRSVCYFESVGFLV